MNAPEPVWNSLEITKLIVQGLTPLLIVLLGILVNRAIKRFEHRQWRNQKLIEKRLEIYDDMAPVLNDLLCYFTFVGCWKDLSPAEVVKLKRTLDKKIYLAAPLFSPRFFSACMELMNQCYETYSGWGKDAKLKTKFERRKGAAGTGWQATWEKMYSTQPSDPATIRKAYQELMKCFSEEIGFVTEQDHLSLGRLPANIK
jgi:hypothetical protein